MLDNFSKQAEIYAKYRPSYPQEMYDFLLEHVPQKENAWDCATGSGQVAAALSPHFKQVFASDISPQQMQHAPQKSNIKYVEAPSENVPFENKTFDLITVAQAIHWFDFDRFYAEVRRTAKPGALLAVIGYGMVRVDEDINPLVDQFYENAFKTHFSENRRYLDEHYRSIPFPFKEISAPDLSISYRWTLDHLEGYFNSWSAVQKIKEEEGINPVDNVIQKLKPVWQGDEKLVTFPVFLRLGSVIGS